MSFSMGQQSNNALPCGSREHFYKRLAILGKREDLFYPREKHNKHQKFIKSPIPAYRRENGAGRSGVDPQQSVWRWIERESVQEGHDHPLNAIDA